MSDRNNPEIMAFSSAHEWELWLENKHADSAGVWVRFFKKGSGIASVTHAEALAAALCFGWIDGQVKTHDAESWLHKFGPGAPAASGRNAIENWSSDSPRSIN